MGSGCRIAPDTYPGYAGIGSPPGVRPYVGWSPSVASTNCGRYGAQRVKGLAIKDVAERTGLAPGTIRMWEQRYGVPEPQRTGSGYRIYTVEDVELLRRAVAFRSRGLSVPAALDRART